MHLQVLAISKKHDNSINSSLEDAEAMTLSEFVSLSAADLSEIISGMHSKTCEVDTLPTAILKT